MVENALGKADGDSRLTILHAFADKGAENPCLSRYGDILRVSINITENEWSESIQADINDMPLKDDTTFDIGWFHPPCGGVSPMSDTGSGSREDWPDLIPLAREVAEKHCEDWVIENKPRDSLDEEVTLTGHMFNLGIEYKRAFETSFSVEQPPIQKKLSETSPFFYSEKSHGWWVGVKGTDSRFGKDHVAKNTIPSAYIDYIMRHYSEHVADDDGPDYSDYNGRMEKKRRQASNMCLKAFREMGE